MYTAGQIGFSIFGTLHLYVVFDEEEVVVPDEDVEVPEEVVAVSGEVVPTYGDASRDASKFLGISSLQFPCSYETIPSY